MKSLLITGAILIAFSLVGYSLYSNLQNQLLEATENLATASASLSAAEATIEEIQAAQEALELEMIQLNTSFSEIRQNNQILQETFESHDLNALAYERPILLESIINNASAEALRCLELISGSALTQQEREASSAEQFNSECPWIYYDVIRMQSDE